MGGSARGPRVVGRERAPQGCVGRPPIKRLFYCWCSCTRGACAGHCHRPTCTQPPEGVGGHGTPLGTPGRTTTSSPVCGTMSSSCRDPERECIRLGIPRRCALGLGIPTGISKVSFEYHFLATSSRTPGMQWHRLTSAQNTSPSSRVPG